MKTLSWLEAFDQQVIFRAKQLSPEMLRFCLFLLFFWFGALKVLGVSPASPLVGALVLQTGLPLPPETFGVYFGVFESLLGILFLIPTPRMTRVTILLLFLHMATTFLPLVLLPGLTWHAFFVPTMEGQYIFKNLVILAAAVTLMAQTKPMNFSSRKG